MVNRVQALADFSQEGQHHHSILQLGGGFDSPTKMYYYVQSILKEINPEYPLEGLMLKLKLQSFGHLIRRTNSSEKTLMLGEIVGKGRKERLG